MHNAQQFHTFRTVAWHEGGKGGGKGSPKLMAISQFALDLKYFGNYHRMLFKFITAALCEVCIMWSVCVCVSHNLISRILFIFVYA